MMLILLDFIVIEFVYSKFRSSVHAVDHSISAGYSSEHQLLSNNTQAAEESSYLITKEHSEDKTKELHTCNYHNYSN